MLSVFYAQIELGGALQFSEINRSSELKITTGEHFWTEKFKKSFGTLF